VAKAEAKRPITAVIVGAGHRSYTYGSYSLTHPEEFKIVAVADPDETRRRQTAEWFKIPPEFCFRSAQEVASRPLMADAVINGTMDKYHVSTSIPLLEAGYHLLLEKPIGTSREEVLQLLATAQRTKRTVMICHVLRYAPFYSEIRKRIAAGEIGVVMNIQTAEHVSYHHMSSCFVRGKWSRKVQCCSSMLMSKCCHDLDILTWLKTGSAPRLVSSAGGRMYFRPEMAPKGAGTRCLVDCPVESDCLYSAKKIYLDHPDRWSFYVWTDLEHITNPTLEQKVEALKTTNPHGRCAFKCDNDVVDHQSVVIQFADGATATHDMVGGTSKPCRTIHIIGTTGEIHGVMEDGLIIVTHPDPRPGHEYSQEHIDLNVSGDMHGGGDLRLVEDFIHVLRGEKPSISSTHLEDSVYGHLIGFAADQSMQENRMIPISIIRE